MSAGSKNLENSDISEHVRIHQNSIMREETSVIVEASKWRGLLVMEVQYILHIPKDQYFNHDAGLELPNCWAFNHQGYASTYS